MNEPIDEVVAQEIVRAEVERSSLSLRQKVAKVMETGQPIVEHVQYNPWVRVSMIVESHADPPPKPYIGTSNLISWREMLCQNDRNPPDSPAPPTSPPET